MDDELQVWTEQYLGLPKACCVAKAGTRIVGGARNTEEAPRMVDVHGTAFFSLGVRGSFTHRHDYVQQAIVGLARWARCDVDPEAYDLFAQYFPGEINRDFGALLATLVVNRIGRQGEHEGSRGAKSIATNYVRQVVGVAAAKAQARFILASVGSVEGITNRDLHRTAVQRRADRRVADELLREGEARAFMQAGERVHGASFRRAEW